MLNRSSLYRSSPLSQPEREELVAAFLSVCEWVQVYFGWRPNLPDEADNHIVELAVAGAASMIVRNNARDFRPAGGSLLGAVTPVTTPSLWHGLLTVPPDRPKVSVLLGHYAALVTLRERTAGLESRRGTLPVWQVIS